MVRYLTGVFAVLLADAAFRDSIAPSLAAGALPEDLTPSQLARATTEAAFATADTDGDDRLSRDEFAAWCNVRGGPPTYAGEHDGPSHAHAHVPTSGDVRNLVVSSALAPPPMPVLASLLHVVGLHAMPISFVQRKLEAAAVDVEVAVDRAAHAASQAPGAGRAALESTLHTAEGASPATSGSRSGAGSTGSSRGGGEVRLRMVLDHAGLTAALEDLHLAYMVWLHPHAPPEQVLRPQPGVTRHLIEVASHVFALFKEHDATPIGAAAAAVGMRSVVDVATLMAGLCVLCAGSPSVKVAAIFTLFDADGSGSISYTEMYRALSAVFSVMLAIHPTLAQQLGGLTVHELAAATTLRCFDECDANRDGFLDQGEFQTWFLASGLGESAGSASQPAPQLPAPAPAAGAEAREQPRIVPPLSLEAVAAFTALPALPATAVCPPLITAAIASASPRVAKIGGVRGPVQPLQRRVYRAVVEPLVIAPEGGRVFDAIFNLYRLQRGGRRGSASDDEADAHAVAAGLSLLCAREATTADAIATTFALFDSDNSGDISMAEAVRYFSAVLAMQQALAPHHPHSRISPHAIAGATAAELFRDADTDHDGRVSASELIDYLLRDIEEAAAATTDAPAPEPARRGGAEAADIARGSNVATMTRLQRFRVFAGLDVVTPVPLLDALSALASTEDGTVDLQAFVRAVEACRTLARRADHGELAANVEYLSELFFAFTPADSTLAQFADLACALVSVCAGGAAARAAAIAFCNDADSEWRPRSHSRVPPPMHMCLPSPRCPPLAGSGFITGAELLGAFASIFTLLEYTDPDVSELLGTALASQVLGDAVVEPIPSTFAHVVTTMALRECGALNAPSAADGSDVLPELTELAALTVDVAMFRTWYMGRFDAGLAAAHRLVAEDVEAAAAAATPADGATAPPDVDMSWCTREEASRLLFLAQTPVNALLRAFAMVADEEGRLSREAFDAVLDTLAEDAERSGASADMSAADQRRAALLRDVLFSVFDTDGNGIVDAPELVAGLTVLAAGSREDKVRAAFLALDVDHDGVITAAELRAYLTAVFTVLAAASPSEIQSLSPARLASDTAAELIAELDTNGDGVIDATEFIAAYANASDRA